MRNFGVFLFILFCIAFCLIGLYVKNYLSLANGYNAKTYCSCYFVSQRSDCLENDLAKFGYLTRTLDADQKSVRSNIYGFLERKAVFRKGLGCTLIKDIDEPLSSSPQIFKPPIDSLHDSVPFPEGTLISIEENHSQVDYQKLNTAIDRIFTEPNINMKRHTRSVLVYHKNALIASKFKLGFTPKTPQLGWSMSKSIGATLAGVMIKDGLISLDQTHLFDQWENTKKSNISLHDLLTMSSGLYFEEEYYKPSLATEMLFGSTDMSEIPMKQKLIKKPGTFFQYSSGTSNILMRFLQNELKKNGKDPIAYLQKKLLDKIGMTHTIIEPDPSGLMATSSYAYASALDWLRFGILYLNKGVWNEEQILPSDWTKYVSTPTPSCDSAAYGAHFWLNAGFKEDQSDRRYPNLPADMYFASGHAGQHVFIFPSKDLIIVRLGNASEKQAWNYVPFVEEVLGSFSSETPVVSYLN